MMKDLAVIPIKRLYRYWTKVNYSYYGSDTAVSKTVTAQVSAFPVIRETPKGYWIEDDFYKKRFVLKGAGKRFAYEAKKDAMYSYTIRCNRRLGYLERQLSDVKAALELIDSGDDSKVINLRASLFNADS